MASVLRPHRAFLIGLAAALTSAAAAAAAPATATFNIPAKRLDAELIDFAVQADISISTRNLAACAPTGRALVGRYTLAAGLTRILAGSGCGFRFVDARAVEVAPLPKPPAPPPPSPRPVATPTPASTDLDAVVVVATRRPTAVDRLAYPVTALGAATLTSQGVADAGDIARLSPSMTVTNLGAGRNKILLRGLSDGPLTGRTQSMVGIYVDDVRVTYNPPDPDLRLVDMEQAVVLRGPQGALYGAGSLGGVLHLVTARPDAYGFSGWVSAGAAATRGGDPSATVEGMVNLPAPGGRGAVRAVAWREQSGGYIDDAGLGLSNVNQTIRFGGRLAASLALGERWTLSAGLIGQAIDASDTQYALAGAAPYTRSNSLREPHDNDFAEANIGLTGDLGWARLRWSTAYVEHQVASRYDATSAPPVAMPAGPIAFDDENDISSLVTEATLMSPDAARIRWLVGVFFARSRQDIALDLFRPGPAAITGFTEDRHDRLDETALFGETTLPLADRLDLTLGGRLFSVTGSASSRIIAPLAGTASTYDGTDRQTGFAPKLLLAWRRSPTTLVYVEAAEGYRAGGLNTTGVPGQPFAAPGGAQPWRRYEGDELWSLEMGGHWQALDGRLQLRVAAFEAHWSNIQSDQLLPNGLPFTANIGDGVNRGVELEGVYRAGALVLTGNALFNAPELDQANAGFTSRGDLALAAVPDLSGGLSAHYAWSLAGNRSFALDGRLAYVGKSTLTFDATTSPTMGDYIDARLAGSLATDRWSLTLAVSNPTNSRGDTFAYGNPFTLRATPQLTPQRPATVGLTLKVGF